MIQVCFSMPRIPAIRQVPCNNLITWLPCYLTSRNMRSCIGIGTLLNTLMCVDFPLMRHLTCAWRQLFLAVAQLHSLKIYVLNILVLRIVQKYVNFDILCGMYYGIVYFISSCWLRSWALYATLCALVQFWSSFSLIVLRHGAALTHQMALFSHILFWYSLIASSCLLQIDDVDVRKPKRISRRSLETESEQNQRIMQTSIRELPYDFETESVRCWHCGY